MLVGALLFLWAPLPHYSSGVLGHLCQRSNLMFVAAPELLVPVHKSLGKLTIDIFTMLVSVGNFQSQKSTL